MYLSSWKRTHIFTTQPYLTNTNKTYYLKNFISTPNNLDFWNFFIKHKKVQHLTAMVKEVPINSLLSLEGDNALETSIVLGYLPLLKQTLNNIDIKKLSIFDSDDLTIIDKLFNQKFVIYKELILFIKKHKIQNLFSNKHMNLLVNSDINKMIYFEKTFPGLFLNLYSEKIDNLNPHFQHVLLKYDVLKIKLSRKFKKKNTKKELFKI